MHITFLKAKVEDAEEIIKVRAEAFYDEVKRYGHGPSLFDSVEKERNFILGNDGLTFCYILKREEEIIGGMGVEYMGDGNYYLGSIFVKKEYQNYGIGSLMLRFLEKKFTGAKKWTLETPYLSFRNHHFYEKNGFNKTGESEKSKDGFYQYQYEKVIS